MLQTFCSVLVHVSYNKYNLIEFYTTFMAYNLSKYIALDTFVAINIGSHRSAPLKKERKSNRRHTERETTGEPRGKTEMQNKSKRVTWLLCCQGRRFTGRGNLSMSLTNPQGVRPVKDAIHVEISVKGRKKTAPDSSWHVSVSSGETETTGERERERNPPRFHPQGVKWGWESQHPICFQSAVYHWRKHAYGLKISFWNFQLKLSEIFKKNTKTKLHFPDKRLTVLGHER